MTTIPPASETVQPDGPAHEFTAEERTVIEVELERSRSRLKIRRWAQDIIQELDASAGRVTGLINDESKFRLGRPVISPETMKQMDCPLPPHES